MVNRLADIVQQTGTLGKRNVCAKLGGHHAGNVRLFDRVYKYILTVAGAVAESAQNFDKLGIDSVNAGFKGRLFAGLLDDLFDLAAAFFDHFFNACRMDTAVGNELFKR